jgi:superfamily I DNA/RNA helicase
LISLLTMSFGFSPSDAVNAGRALKTAVDAFKDKTGSRAKISEASTNLSASIAAVQNYEAVVNRLAGGNLPSTADFSSRIESLKKSQKTLGALLSEHQRPSRPATTCKDKIKIVSKELSWAFGGEKEYATSTSRTAPAWQAVQLDATM